MTSVEIDKTVFNDIYIPYLREMARIQIFFWWSQFGKISVSCAAGRC